MFFLCKKILLAGVLVTLIALPSFAKGLDPFDLQVKQWAGECRAEVTDQLNLLLTSGTLTVAQLFDTFYIPIPKTNPQKYHTQYDIIFDGTIRTIIDKYQKKNKRIRAVYAADINGYVSTHNSSFARPLTGDASVDLKKNRTKRMFNDKTGLTAARSLEPFLMQKYNTDGGRSMKDMSVPITIQGRHWGALRIVYTPK